MAGRGSTPAARPHLPTLLALEEPRSQPQLSPGGLGAVAILQLQVLGLGTAATKRQEAAGTWLSRWQFSILYLLPPGGDRGSHPNLLLPASTAP